MQEFPCPKCGKATWKSYWAMLGHSGRCKGIPGLLERVAKVQASPVPPPPGPSPNSSSSGSLSGSPPADRAAPSGATGPPRWAPPPLDLGAARLLEARIAILENENKIMKEIITNDLKHLGAQQETTSTLVPLLVLGGVVVLIAVAIFAGPGDAAGEGPRQALGDPDPRPRSPIVGGLVGKLVDRAATRMIDKALGKIF